MQWTSKLRRPAAGTVLGGLALVVALAGSGYAVAQTSQPEKVVACQSNKMLFLADPATGQCPAGQQRVELTTTSYSGFASASDHEALKGRIAALEAKLSKVSYDETGLNNLPTLTVNGANLQIVNGFDSQRTNTFNGLGNLFIGYNEQESDDTQTGSHNLIIGRDHTFTSYGGLLAGSDNSLRFAFASVSGGTNNTASGVHSSVSGGGGNTASGQLSSVSGGGQNAAIGLGSSVSGGQVNTASGGGSSLLGGQFNTASGNFSSLLGGKEKHVSTEHGTSP